MTVIEIWPGGGWYTEILAPYLRDRGKLYAAHFSADAELKYFRELRGTVLHKIAAAPALYDKGEVTEFDPPRAVAIAPPGQISITVISGRIPKKLRVS
jgi:predicted methyltransferase